MSSNTPDDTTEQFATYLSEEVGLSECTTDVYVRHVNEFLDYAGTRIPTENDVVEYYEELITSDWTQCTIRKAQSAVAHYFRFLEWTEERDEIGSLLENEGKSDRESEDVINHPTDYESITDLDWIILHLLISSDLRISEIKNISLEDIDVSDE